jgi:hypothetical protein
MTLLIMQSSSASRHFLPLRSIYSPQHPVLKYLQSMYDVKLSRRPIMIIFSDYQPWAVVYNLKRFNVWCEKKVW